MTDSLLLDATYWRHLSFPLPALPSNRDGQIRPIQAISIWMSLCGLVRTLVCGIGWAGRESLRIHPVPTEYGVEVGT